MPQRDPNPEAAHGFVHRVNRVKSDSSKSADLSSRRGDGQPEHRLADLRALKDGLLRALSDSGPAPNPMGLYFQSFREMLRPRFPVSIRLLVARIRRSALGRKAWDLLRSSAAVRRLVSPFRPPADVREFDPAYYVRENPDVTASGMDPLYH